MTSSKRLETTEKWLNAKQLAALFKCDRQTIVNYARFGKYLFPRGKLLRDGHLQWFWKMSDILRWKYKRIADFKKPIQGIR